MINIAKPLIGPGEKKAVAEVLESGMLADGPKVREFEEKFAEFCGTKFAVAASSGTTSLHAALLALGVGPGDEVITTPFSFFATASTIGFCGATPVFADVNPGTYNIDPSKIGDCVTVRTKAIMPVHLYGQPAEMDAINEIAEEHDLKVLEDACQAHGAEYNGKRSGSLGDAAAFSFYPTKNMTTGEGGIVTMDDEEICERVRLFVNHGQSKRYSHAVLGYNYRMTSIAAAIGIEQLGRLPGFNERRRSNALLLDRGLEDVDGMESPAVAKGMKHVYHQYTVKCEKRKGVLETLKNAGVGYGVYYPSLLYESPVFTDCVRPCPVAEKLKQMVVSLPVHAGLREEDIRKVVEAISS